MITAAPILIHLAVGVALALGLATVTFAAPPAPPASPPRETEALLALHGFGRPAHEAALDAVAAKLTEAVANPPPSGAPVPADLLLHTLAAAGVTDAQVFPFTLRHRTFGDFATALPAFLARLDRTKPPTHYGLSTFVRSGQMVTSLVLVHRGVTLQRPIPRQSEPGGFVPLKGDLLRGYFRPRLFVSPPGGARVLERPAWTSERKVDTSVWFDAGPGIYGVEIVADSQFGPVVLHNAEVHVGVPVPSGPVARFAGLGASAYDGPPDLALGRMVNEQRTAHGLPPLRIWPELASVALAHAVELDERRILVHATGSTGNLQTRLQSRGMRFTLAAENLADAATPRQALAAFLASPGHKRNLLDPALTHMGIGLSGRYFVLAMVRLGP
ncbi:CAP domain-containing protein [Myxococcota bacterium]|nr:CAP domain-containing protein [Myxococcota bacterium]